jgi:MFS family permease
MWNFFKHRLHPFAHSSFRFFFFAQLFSAIGTWSHELARAWIVLDLAGTATALGALLLTSSLPGLFLTLHGGALADRKDARKLFFVTKSILAVSAFSLFVITEFFEVKVWMIFVFGFIEGAVNSFDGPAFTAIFARTIPRSDFQQGLAIHSTSFHVSRMIGPALAGLIMAVKGPSYVFLFDGLSYLAVIYMILKVKLRDRAITSPELAQQNQKGMKHLLDGLKFFFNDPNKRYKQLQLFASIVIIVPLLNLVFRSYLKHKFSMSAEEFGYLFSFPALGAMVGAVFLTLAAMRAPIRNLIYGVPCLVISVLLLPEVKTPHLAAILLGFSGFFSYLNVASITQSLHLETPDDYRGRLGAIMTLGFTSVGPLMGWPMGLYTDTYGFETAIRNFTIIFALISAALAYSNFRRRPKDVIDMP